MTFGGETWVVLTPPVMTTRIDSHDLLPEVRPLKFFDPDRRVPRMFQFRWEVWTISSRQASSFHTLDVNQLQRKEELAQSLSDAIASASASSTLRCIQPGGLLPSSISTVPIIDFADMIVVIIKDGINLSNEFHSYHRYRVNLVSSLSSYFGDDTWFLELESDLVKNVKPEIAANERLIVSRGRLDHRDKTLQIRYHGEEYGTETAQMVRFVIQKNSSSPRRTVSTNSGASFKTAKGSQDWMEPGDPMDDIMAGLSSQPKGDADDTDSTPKTPSGRTSPSLSEENSENYSLIVIPSSETE